MNMFFLKFEYKYKLFYHFLFLFFFNINIYCEKSFIKKLTDVEIAPSILYNSTIDKKSYKYAKNNNRTVVNSYYIHRKGFKDLKVSFYFDYSDNYNLIFYFLMPYEGIEKYLLSNKNREILKDNFEFGVSLINNGKIVEIQKLEEIDSDQKLSSIFGKRKTRFGTIYKVFFNFGSDRSFKDLILRFYNFDFFTDLKIDI